MSEPFIGEIQIYGFNFNPRGWAFCNGATLPISQNTALFSLIGTIYGGNGQTTFQLPNLAGRAAMNQGNGPGLTPRTMGETDGTETVSLTTAQIPNHRHVVRASLASGTQASPAGGVPTTSEEQLLFDTGTDVAMTPPASSGSGIQHENRQPYLGINFCIALQGVYPSFP
jgi:microcystin-dependent protein